ncbi:MAG: hypothetical protein GY953_11030, partial [bacterium]|nr:hypothetical protein [bacterium]
MVGDTWLKRADKQELFGFDVWEFSLRSLRRPYGRLFLRSVLMRHPLRAMAGLRTYRRKIRLARDSDHALVGLPSWDELAVGPWVVGLGFCEKPIEPPCPSGRANHRCWLLGQEKIESLPAPCRQCAVREVSEHALPAGATVHVMTSASDFADDVLLP